MATCSSLRPLFETQLPEKPTLMESLAWSQAKSMKPMEHSVTEIFGELHFQEKKSENPIITDNQPLDSLFKDNTYKPNNYMNNEKKPIKPMEPQAITEIFGELHFQEKPDNRSPFISLEENQGPKGESILDSLFGARTDKNLNNNGQNQSLDSLLKSNKDKYKGGSFDTKSNCSSKSSASFESKNSTAFSPKNIESLKKCTEGLGSESSDDVDDLVSECDYSYKNDDNGKADSNGCLNLSSKRVKKGSGREFPPPISSIGRSGKPRVCFKSFREGGRFVLREIKIPNHELLSASRQDGRLKLKFVLPEADIAEGEEGDEAEEQQGESNVHNREVYDGKE